ncbi:Phosphatidylinositol 5-phosphate 4-kinase type-2 beta [Clonorchis sinensis]|uniref:1-phosphatidylinositol-5-phosphate 4-kinase n=1 Tax=Clonorchis sinensis TaxID=79923 RepID=A0A8T1MSJ5_CLOSI|nr:Phosphatidylinositol 5-phosphate 4-kinase type-2 beta [Clonorchis sinensis]
MTTVSKQKKVKNVKQKLKLFRANEPLKSVLMWGINYSFSALNHVKPRAMLLKDDFKAYMKVKINNHLFNKENMPSRFKFKEYCPIVFKALRARFGVNKLDYWDAFTGYQPLWDSARGKSGSKFLVTYNRQFVAKAISSEEVEQMHNLLEDYYAYIVHCHGQTLLPQYLGLYRLTVNDQETYILVMRNVFSPRLTIHKKYDLKGSAVDREANEKEKAKPLPTLKDNDFLNEVCKIYIGEEAKSKLLSRLESDVQFLQENNLMDYSLLIGIHEVDRASEAAASSDEAGGTDQDGAVDDRTASAGDGLGSLTSQWHLRRLSTGRRSVDPCVVALAGSQTGGYRSAGDEDDEDEGGVFSDPGIPIPGAIVSLTPPESPPDTAPFSSFSVDQLHPSFEYYGITSSPGAPRPMVYFVAIIDLLTRYGMRKRTAQTYKTVKHGTSTEVSSVKPEMYGKRLLDFMSQCID